MGVFAFSIAEMIEKPDYFVQEFLNDREYCKFKLFVKELISAKPNDYSALCYSGLVKAVSKDYDGALADLEKALPLKNAYVANYFRAITYYLMKDYDTAIELCDKAIKRKKSVKGAYRLKMKAFIKKNELRKAVGVGFDYAEANGVLNEGIQYKMANLMHILGDNKNALAHFKKLKERMVYYIKLTAKEIGKKETESNFLDRDFMIEEYDIQEELASNDYSNALDKIIRKDRPLYYSVCKMISLLSQEI